MSAGKDTHGFRGLWRKVKSPEKPDEVGLLSRWIWVKTFDNIAQGIPFDTEDAMFNPPVAAFQQPATTEPNPPAAPKRPVSRLNCFHFGSKLFLCSLINTNHRREIELFLQRRTYVGCSKSVVWVGGTQIYCLTH